MIRRKRFFHRKGACLIKALIMVVMFMALVAPAMTEELEVDRIPTSEGELAITFIGHASLIFEYRGKVIHLDPWTPMGDYTALPDADLILLTHEHIDHLDPSAIEEITTPETLLVYTESCSGLYDGGNIMHNGDTMHLFGISIEAVPAYNIHRKRTDGSLYHQKGVSNGYILTFGEKRVYCAAETEIIPELSNVKDIDIAFFSMNMPYNMTPEDVAEAARIVKPRILYPIHFSESDVGSVAKLLRDEPDIEVRVRDMK